MTRDPPGKRPSEFPRSTIPMSGFERPPERIGPYKILETIGEGGMGTVYMAEQTEPVNQEVALKVIKRDELDGGTRTQHLIQMPTRVEIRLSIEIIDI